MNLFVERSDHYVPALDGLRAFAVLAVIAYHMKASWAPGGLLGVTMFFVLSGYLITGLLIREYQKSGTISLSNFWLRRVRRIIPAVVFAVLGTGLLCTLFDHALLTKMRPDVIPTLLFVNNWWQIVHDVSYFAALGDPSPLTHYWSLAIEEQFYLVWPVALLVCMKAGASKKALRTGTIVLAAFSALEMLILFDPSQDPSRVYYGTDTRAFSLLIGAWLSFVWPAGLLSKDVKIEPRLRWRLVEEYGPECYAQLPDGRLLFEGGFADRDNAVTWLLSFEDGAELLEPEELRTEMATDI